MIACIAILRTTSAGKDYFPNNKIAFEAGLLAKEGPRELSPPWRVVTAPENEIRGVVPEAKRNNVNVY